MGFVKKVKRVVIFFSLATMGFGLQACLEKESEESQKASGRRSLDCPDYFVEVQGNDFYGTHHFCAMVYEAKALHKETGVYSAYGCKTETEACVSGEEHALDIDEYKASAHWDHKPWVNISQEDAITACQSMGEGYDLITNDQWQTIARSIEKNKWNWDLFAGEGRQLSVGNANIGNVGEALNSRNDNRCVTGPCGGGGAQRNWHEFRRSFRLSNKKFIWDISGNVAEWVKDRHISHGYGRHDYVSNFSHSEFTTINPSSLTLDGVLGTPRKAKDQFGPEGDYEILNDINHGHLGYAYIGVSAMSDNGASIIRGGDYTDEPANAIPGDPNPQYASGIFAAYIDTNDSRRDKYTGFRCVWKPQASQP